MPDSAVRSSDGLAVGRKELQMRYDFQEVSVKGTVRWKENGKARQKTRKFYQTINPFNRNEDGTQKTREQILIEVTAVRNEWVRRESANDKLTDEPASVTKQPKGN